MNQQKESFKWEFGIERVIERFPEFIRRLIFVSDRESDIYELLMYLLGNELRYVVRASWNRKLANHEKKLFEKIAEAPVMGEVLIHVPQKGGRSQRSASVEVRACSLTLSSPSNDSTLPPLTVNVVQAKELAAEDPMCWTLLTSEPIDSLEQALYVIRSYGLRWKVEDFHRCWKSGGTNVEKLRLQSQGAILRAATVLALVAIRISQLRDEADPFPLSDRTKMRILRDFTSDKDDSPDNSGSVRKKKTLKGLSAPERPCTTVLSDVEWKVLWMISEKGKRLPRKVPNRRWAYHAIGRLGGWYDSKRTGRVGLKALWRGYERLQEMAHVAWMSQHAEIKL